MMAVEGTRWIISALKSYGADMLLPACQLIHIHVNAVKPVRE